MNFVFLMYPGIEPVDLAGIGVVSMARRIIPDLTYSTVAATLEPCVFSNGLKVLPDQTFGQVTGADVILVPGGPGWQQAARDESLLRFLKTVNADVICTLCTGAMIAAAAGLLDGRVATTKVQVVPPEVSPVKLLALDYPQVRVCQALVADSGDVLTGGGVSLCIDTVLHLIATRISQDKARQVARLIEYEASWAANQQRLGVVTSLAA